MKLTLDYVTTLFNSPCKHNLHSGSANDVFGTVCLENCHSDLQRGQDVVVSQNRSDQELPFADPKCRSMLEGNQSKACINTTDQQAWFVPGNWSAPLHICLIRTAEPNLLATCRSSTIGSATAHGLLPKDCAAALAHPTLREIFTAHKQAKMMHSHPWTVLGQAPQQNRVEPAWHRSVHKNIPCCWPMVKLSHQPARNTATSG